MIYQYILVYRERTYVKGLSVFVAVPIDLCVLFMTISISTEEVFIALVIPLLDMIFEPGLGLTSKLPCLEATTIHPHHTEEYALLWS